MSGEDDGESSASELVDFNEAGDIIDNEEESSELTKQIEEHKRLRALKLGFEPQKEIVFNKQLPYSGNVELSSHVICRHMSYISVNCLISRRNRPRIHEMVRRHKIKPGSGHRSEGAETGHCHLDIPLEQIHQNVWPQVPEGRSRCPDQVVDEFRHCSRLG